jgi:hypothetical protein
MALNFSSVILNKFSNNFVWNNILGDAVIIIENYIFRMMNGVCIKLIHVVPY